MSGFTGANAAVGELRAFLDLVKSGRIPRGSVLVVENVDRPSRLPADRATAIISELVRGGIDVATTHPEQLYTAANIGDLGTWIPLQVTVSLAHAESKKKSDRGRDNWARKRAAIAAGTKLGNLGPFWLELQADRRSWRVLDPQVAAVRTTVRLAANGWGAGRIARRLNETDPDGPTGRGWQPNVVRKTLRGRAVLGELVTTTQTESNADGRVRVEHTPTGAPIAGYYPAIIEERTYYATRAALDGRRKTGGRRANWTNLFGGLLIDDHDNEKMIVAAGRAGTRRYVSAGAMARKPGSAFRTVPVDMLESALLSQIAELRVADITEVHAGPESDVESWSARLIDVNHRIKQTRERAATAADPGPLLELLEQPGTRRREVIAGLESARAAAATPAGDALGDATQLIALLAAAEPAERHELRGRVRARLARLVTEIRVRVERPAGSRTVVLWAVVRFRVRGCRAVFVDYDPPSSHGRVRLPGNWRAWSAEWRCCCGWRGTVPAFDSGRTTCPACARPGPESVLPPRVTTGEIG